MLEAWLELPKLRARWVAARFSKNHGQQVEELRRVVAEAFEKLPESGGFDVWHKFHDDCRLKSYLTELGSPLLCLLKNLLGVSTAQEKVGRAMEAGFAWLPRNMSYSKQALMLSDVGILST